MTETALDKKPIPRNVLVADNPIDTMLNCAAVLKYLDAHSPDDNQDHIDPVYCLGRSLLNRTLIHALEAHQ